MLRFREWLCIVEGRIGVPPAVLAGYEHIFKEQLQQLIQRTQNPALRRELLDMLDCPVRDSRGRCRSFTDYILSALVNNGVHSRYDIEAALSYVVEKMIMPHKDTGEPRATVFAGFQERPDFILGTNPLQARFLTFLGNAIQNIRQGKVPRLANVEHRPQGTVSIGLGRRQEGDPAGGVSPDQIAARPSGDAGLGEMVEDIEGLLRKKEGAYGFPLVALFRAIMGGMNLAEQRRRFGDRRVRPARQVIVRTIEDYARSTDNRLLLNLLQRLKDGQAGREVQATRTQATTPKPVLSDQERDYASIAQVVARFDRPVGTADLGRYRRRWLEYPPRDAASGYRNRLGEVLAAMVRDDVLRATRTTNGATVYGRGPRFEEFHRQDVGVAK